MIVSGHQALLGGNIDWRPTAAALLAITRDWFSWNDSAAGNISPYQTMTNYFGGGAVSAYGAGVKGKRAMLTVQSVANLNMTGYAASDPVFFGGVFYINAAAGDTTEHVGFTDNGTGHLYERAVLKFTKASGVVTVKICSLDISGSGSPLVYSAAQTLVSGNSYLILPYYDPTTRLWALSINDAASGSVALTGHNYGFALWSAALNPYLGVGFADLPLVLHDETFYGVGVLTADMRTYLYNGGSFKSYAEVLADAA